MRVMMLGVVGLFVLGASSLEAQRTGHAFCDQMPKDEFARVIRAGDPDKKCNAPIDRIRAAYNRRFGLGLQNNEEFATWVSRLVVQKCTDVAGDRVIRFGRVITPKDKPLWVDLTTGWPRKCGANEMLLCDPQLGVCVGTDYCWNPPLDRLTMLSVSIPSPILGEPVQTSIELVRRFEEPPPIERPVVQQPRFVVKERSWLSRNWPWLAGGTVTGVLGYFCATDWCRESIKITVINKNR